MIGVKIIDISFGVAIFVAVAADLKIHKIPNKVILYGLVAGIFCRCMENGLGAVLDVAVSMMIPFLVLFPVFCAGMLGAGDIKLLCMAATVMEPLEALYLLFYACVFGAVWAAVKIIRDKSLKRRFTCLKEYLFRCFSTGQLEKYFVKEQGYDDTIAFALPIGISFLLYVGGMY